MCRIRRILFLSIRETLCNCSLFSGQTCKSQKMTPLVGLNRFFALMTTNSCRELSVLGQSQGQPDDI